VKVMHDRVAAIDVHKDMVKVRSPGFRVKDAGPARTDVLEFRTFYGVAGGDGPRVAAARRHARGDGGVGACTPSRCTTPPGRAWTSPR